MPRSTESGNSPSRSGRPFPACESFSLGMNECGIADKFPSTSQSNVYLHQLMGPGENKSYLCCQNTSQFRSASKRENRISISELRSERLLAENRLVRAEIDKALCVGSKDFQKSYNLEIDSQLLELEDGALVPEICVHIIPKRESVYFSPQGQVMENRMVRPVRTVNEADSVICSSRMSSSQMSRLEFQRGDPAISSLEFIKRQVLRRTESLVKLAQRETFIASDERQNGWQGVQLDREKESLNSRMSKLLKHVEEWTLATKRLRAKFRHLLHLLT